MEEQSRLVEAAVTQPGLEGTKGWQRSGRRLGEELRRGCSEARRTNFQIRNLTERELSFLLEYVCTS